MAVPPTVNSKLALNALVGPWLHRLNLRQKICCLWMLYSPGMVRSECKAICGDGFEVESCMDQMN